MPDPMAVLLHLPVLEPTEKLTPPLTHTLELLIQITTTVSNLLSNLSVGYTRFTRLLKDVFNFAAGVVFIFRGGPKMWVNFYLFENLAILYVTFLGIGAGPAYSFLILSNR